MSYEELFPRGLAFGKAFCNRVSERKRLGQNIDHNQHTLLMSPRRYGKTSLVKFVLSELEYPFGEADLFIAIDAKRIEDHILVGIKAIFSQISSPLEQKIESIRNFFQKISAKWIVGTKGLQLALVPESGQDPASNVLEALQAIENLLSEKKQKAVLFIDEIQEIGEVAEGKAIEGAIRHVAQQSKYLILIFSGSNRHLLSKMFYDKSRPLYKLCDRIILDRIAPKDYIKHINALANKKWKSPLSDAVLNEIFQYTGCHPYFVNVLCRRLWEDENTELPTELDVKKKWFDFVREERAETLKEVSILSIGQRKIIITIANGTVRALTGKESLRNLNMTSSSVTQALKLLAEKDYIERLESSEYKIVDPIIKSTLQIHFGNN